MVANVFSRVARWSSRATAHGTAFSIALGVIFAWALLGPRFGYSDTWQLVINTSTTIVTFLMVFLLQNTQMRESEAIQIKLDELIRAQERADESLLDLEELDEAELHRIEKRYESLARKAREKKDGGAAT